MYRYLKCLSIGLLISAFTSCHSDNIIEVAPCDGDATQILNEAVARAAEYDGKPVTIRLAAGDYHISRSKATAMLYHISNTASTEENPDQTKHIGILLKNMRNVTFDGNGARLITHGEMTSFVIDSCSDIRLKNFSLVSADPSVVEVMVVEKDSASVIFDITPPTDFEVNGGQLVFKGENWTLRNGHTQIFYPERNVTLRCNSPLDGSLNVEKTGARTVRIEYESAPDVSQGEVFQIRHGIRNEVCVFINRSKDVEISDAEFNFLGNFGIVAQFSENLTYDNIRCCPEEGSGRTDAGFADFVQMSSCKGKIVIRDSHFEGAHDDPINIHGTHLRVIGSNASDRLTVRYSHPQTYGFQPYYEGDSIEVVNVHTLNPQHAAKVVNVSMINDYDWEITLDTPVPASALSDDTAVENITWTPEVEIIGNYFARIPTRGILITTRRKSVIEGNTFFRIPMASILVSDDARGWYESGPVHDLAIRRNTFIECADPVISILPEIDRLDQPVHRNILIEDNTFIGAGSDFLKVNGTDNLVIRNNHFRPL